PYRPYRPYIFNTVPGPRFAGRDGPRFVIPSRPARYIPTQVRPRGDLGDAFSNRGGGVEPRTRRPNSAGPSRAQPRVSGGGSRPSGSRGFGGGGSRPASRSGGGGGSGGGRRQ